MNKLLVLIFVALNLVNTKDFDTSKERDTDDSAKSTAEYLLSYGYNFEEHKVLTNDGYILTLWRIPKRIHEKRIGRTPILLQHGVLDTAFSWLFKRIKHNLATILVDAGYDVWLGNNRGCIHSLEHVDSEKYNWADIGGQFWDFSFDHMGSEDFPAMIDYIRDATGYEKILYVGHSQGAVQYFIKAMLDPDYVNKYVQAFVGLAPVLFISHIPGALMKFMEKFNLVEFLYNVKFKNFMAFPFMKNFYIKFCKMFPGLARRIITTITGETRNQTFDLDRLSVIATNEAGGTSTQNLLHWMQLIRENNKFKMFDYGTEGNIEKYRKPTPPEYNLNNLQNITLPMYLMVADSDNIISPTDFNLLLDVLPKETKYDYIDDYGHLDYIWADDAHVKVYPQLIEFLAKAVRS